MSSTNAERQRQYRARALKDPDGLLLARLQVLLSAHADACLTRLIASTGKSKREVVELAIIQMEKSVTL